MALAVLGTLINFFITFVTAVSGAYPVWLVGSLGVCAVISLLGVLVAAAGNDRVGGTLVIIGAIFFAPIGLIAVYGGRKLLYANEVDPSAAYIQ